MLPTKIVIIGAGSAIFGLNTLSALLNSKRLAGSHIALVDRNAESLGRMTQLAQRVNREWGAGMTITQHTRHEDALDGASFVVSAIEAPPREKLWRQDYEITLKYGVRQPYAENGGPGGFAHTIRNVLPVLDIVRVMEQACPDAWFLNFSNPMMRICDLIHRYSKIKVVGLCHQIFAGYGMVGYALARDLGIDVPAGVISTHADPDLWPRLNKISHQAAARVHIQAAGLNHFTWMISLRDKQTGEDLYPLFRQRWAELEPSFEPLTQRVFCAFGLFPIPGDEHLCEYLPWVSNPVTRPWEKYEISLYDWDRLERRRNDQHDFIARVGAGLEPLGALRSMDSEGALEIIENVAGAGNSYHLAVNLPNQGQIANLPMGAIVETPGVISGAGVQGVSVGSLPEGVAELLRREITAVRLCVDAGAHGDRQLALQCLLLDPVIADMDAAREILDDYLETYREFAPQFWR
jgi:alpha-galactosidase